MNLQHIWGIILAGGEGKRLTPFIEKLYGTARPKQYCAIVGQRSMLRHTLDRVRLLIPPERILTIVNQSHVELARDQLAVLPSETIVVQPYDRGTGVGILLPLLHVIRRDPDALVALFPSDHFVMGEERFIEHLTCAYDHVSRYPDLLVVIGYRPARPETEYGWIEKGEEIGWIWGSPLFRVRRFWEKPKQPTAQTLYQRGCIWNTLILVGAATTLRALFSAHVPTMYSCLMKVGSWIGSHEEYEKLVDVYRGLPNVNFSHTVMKKSVDTMRVLQVADIYWSDWGEEERIRRDAERFNLHLHEPQPQPIKETMREPDEKATLT